MSARKKVETELITGSYLYEQIRRGVMLGSEDAVVEFEALLQGTLESMIRVTFQPDNDMVEFYARDRRVAMNRTCVGWLNIIKNILVEFGVAAQANLSGKVMHTTEGVVGASTNVRRFDIIDDQNAEDPYKKNTLRLHPRIMAEVAAGNYNWVDKAWEAWFTGEEVTFGEGGDVQVSPIVEEQVTIMLWAITHAMETDHLYRRYAILQEKMERAIEAGEEQVKIYDDLLDKAVDKMSENKVKITKLAGKSLIELKQVVKFQKMVDENNKSIANDIENNPGLTKFYNMVERAEQVIIDLNNIKEGIAEEVNQWRGQMINFNKKYNRMSLAFKKLDIDLEQLDDRYGIDPPSITDKITDKLSAIRGEDKIMAQPVLDIPVPRD